MTPEPSFTSMEVLDIINGTTVTEVGKKIARAEGRLPEVEYPENVA